MTYVAVRELLFRMLSWLKNLNHIEAEGQTHLYDSPWHPYHGQHPGGARDARHTRATRRAARSQKSEVKTQKAEGAGIKDEG